VALGNELTNDRPWLGEIQQAVVSAGDGIDMDYTRPGVLELLPAHFWYTPHPFTLIPFAESDMSPRLRLVDAALNLIGYIPLGLLLGGIGGGRFSRRRTVSLILVACAVSAGLETMQFGIATRHPSTTDVLLNTLGGSIGIRLAWWIKAGMVAKMASALAPFTPRPDLGRVPRRPACPTVPCGSLVALRASKRENPPAA
jgi:VanZ family protein